MQFNQPTGFQPTGFPNCGQPYGFNNPTPSFQFNGYPGIIGEGNVTSIISPDGSTQFLFMPTTQWWGSCPQNPNAVNFNNPYVNNLGAWFVRSIYNPIQPTAFNQPHPAPSDIQHPRASASDWNLNLQTPTFPLKFHNDNYTSTSDIHYFVPKQYNWFQNSKGSAAVQVDAPFVTFNQPGISTKQCICTSPIKNKDKQHTQCMCYKLKDSNSGMSIEEAKSDLNCREQKSATCKCKKQTASGKLKRSESKKLLSNVKCKCKEQSASDKSVTTYADQATGYTPEKGQETQTDCSNSILKEKVETEMWKPVTPTSKKTMKSKSYCTLRLCESGCSSRSCDSCSSETELDE